MALGSERIMPRKDRKIVTPSFCHTHNISDCAQPSRGTTCGMTTNMQADVMENSVCDEAANQRELKKQWRAHAIARRKQTSKEERLEAGRKLAEQARKANLIHSFTTVAAFASMGSEMSMMPMLQHYSIRIATCWCHGSDPAWILAGANLATFTICRTRPTATVHQYAPPARAGQ